MTKSMVLSLVLGVSAQAWAKPATITAFTPQNLSETTNQIRAVFSEKMVALGVTLNADIFSVSCSPQMQGTAQWEDEKNWTFDFKSKLQGNKIPGGTRCQVSLKQGVKTVTGEPVTGKQAFQFQIDGPNIISIFPGDTNGTSKATVSEDQVFALGLDSEVDQSSVLKNAYFKIDGVASNVQIRVLSEAEKRSLMKAANFPNWQFSQDLPLLMVQAKQAFPANKKISLVWGPGIKSPTSGLSRQRTLVLPYESRSLLTATFSCNRENAKADCSPFSDMTLSFSSDIPADLAKQIRLVGADGKVITAEIEKGASAVSQITFSAVVRENQAYKLEIPSGIKDQTGRPLSNGSSFPLTVKTADFPPLAKFAADFGIIEANQKPVLLPATLRNLEAQVIGQKFAPTAVQGSTIKITGDNFPAVIQWMKNLDIKGSKAASFKDRDHSIFTDVKAGKPSTFNIPLKANGKAFEVVGIPLGGPGFYVVELQSRLLGRSLLGKDTTMYVPSGALVTNMVVHSKWGKENSLFWVTALDSGTSVSGAQVTVYDCAGKALATLQSDANGLAKYTGDLKSKVNPDACAVTDQKEQTSSKYDSGFFVAAQKDNDFTFTHSGWTDGIEAWRFGSIDFNSPEYASNGPIAHTVLDRTLLRAGDTVSMKNFIRMPSIKGLILMSAQSLPNQAWIEHTDSQTRYVADLKWDANGTSVAQFAIPKDAKLGLYSVTLVKATGQQVAASYYTSSFQVMEFKVPQMKGTIAFPAKVQQLVQPGNLETQVSVNYQDGGPVINKAVTFRYTVSRGYGVYFDEYPRMSFGADRIVEKHGRQQDGSEQNEQTVQVPVRLNAKGSALVTIPNLAKLDAVKTVTAQLEFTDSNSEAQNVTRTVNVYPAAQLVAVSATDGFSSKKDMKFTVAVVDLKGKPVAGAAPALQLFEEITYTHKTQMVGGFYSSESFTDVNPVTAAFKCQGVTDKKGLLNCEATAPSSGNYIVQAEVRDSSGNSSYGSDNFYVRGKRRAWFPSDNNDRMDLLSQQTQAQSGQKAVFQVKMPYDTATVLVTVEREGILDSFVTTVSTQNPVITLDVKPEYAPNVFVSALAVRGRVTGTGAEPTATVDLGKPSYKLGLVPLNVNWKDHSLKVTVTPSKDTYKPREMASVDVTVVNALGQAVPNAEFALAVVDKGLLELAKNKTWDLLQVMMGKRPLTVQTSTAQMQVIGKRHYGLKAKPTGGDGGSAPTRELFDTLVKWVDRVKTDASGKATVTFPMNDSLTAFQVVAVAHAGTDKFGKGEATIVAQQDIVIIPAVAQTARTGDSYGAEFTIRNSTKVTKTVTVNGRVKVTYADGHVSYIDLSSQTLTLEPLDSQLATLGNVAIPIGAVSADFELSVQDQNKVTIDSIKISQKVNPQVITRTWMAQLSRIDSGLAPINVSLPSQALPNQGGVKVSLLGSLTGGLDTVKDTLSIYPFMSLEYLVSSAVASGSQANWDAAMKKLPAYLDAEGFVQYYLSTSSAQGSDVLTAYILSLSNYSGYVIPQDARAKMTEALSNFVQGKSKANRAKNDTVVDIFTRRVNAIEVLARYNAAQATWLSSLPTVTPQQISTATLINLISTYSTLKTAPGRSQKLDEYQAAIRLRLTRVGTGLKLTTDSAPCGYCMSSIDGDQLRLILVLTGSADLTAAWNSDVPLLVQAAVGMMNRGAWDLTVADAYGVLAMKSYGKVFEKQTVTGITNVNFASAAPKAFDWSTSQKGGVFDFGWPGPGTYAVGLNHQGTGTPWAIVAVNAAVPLTQKVERHITLTKTLDPQKAVYKKGDEITVTLEIKAQTSLSQVSLVDPIPAGAKIEGTGLDNDAGNGPQGMYPDYQELANDGYHASYGVIPAETFKVVYKIRLNNAGTFNVPATRIEAIYAPENFAEVPNSTITVQP